MISRSFLIAIISLLLLSFPGYSLAAEDHSGHGISPSGSPAGGHDSHLPGSSQAGSNHGAPLNADMQSSSSGQASHGSGHDQPGTVASGHDSNGPNGHSSNDSGHGEQGSGHGEKGNSSLEPVKNLLVGGFAGLNALIIAVAAYLKIRWQRGVAG